MVFHFFIGSSFELQNASKMRSLGIQKTRKSGVWKLAVFCMCFWIDFRSNRLPKWSQNRSKTHRKTRLFGGLLPGGARDVILEVFLLILGSILEWFLSRFLCVFCVGFLWEWGDVATILPWFYRDIVVGLLWYYYCGTAGVLVSYCFSITWWFLWC